MPVWTMNLPTPQGRGQPYGYAELPTLPPAVFFDSENSQKGAVI